ncbi:MAG: hypothetical protein EKK37_04725 [Sphingobacteriales bacterium]|nr:MAG: hypothetical protein EKK37_04725 [Sphingobacteriales bacterium]
MQKISLSKITTLLFATFIFSLSAAAQATKINPAITQTATQNIDTRVTVEELAKKLAALEAENKQLKDELAKLKTAEQADYKVLDYSLGQLKKSLTDVSGDLSSFKTTYSNHYHIVNGIVGTSIYAGNVQVKTSQADNAKKTGTPQ